MSGHLAAGPVGPPGPWSTAVLAIGRGLRAAETRSEQVAPRAGEGATGRHPVRLRRRRGRGRELPQGAVYVGRSTVWSNPFVVSRSSDFHGLPGSWFVRGEDGAVFHPDEDDQASARRKAVELYAREVLEGRARTTSVELIRSELAGGDLVCWCPSGVPCHADVLLQIANSAPRQAHPAPEADLRPSA